jgi:transcriptional regulator with XRE-family HTH domain
MVRRGTASSLRLSRKMERTIVTFSGRDLIYWRTGKGMGQKQAAEFFGVDRSTMFRWESDSVSIPGSVARLCRSLDLDNERENAISQFRDLLRKSDDAAFARIRDAVLLESTQEICHDSPWDVVEEITNSIAEWSRIPRPRNFPVAQNWTKRNGGSGIVRFSGLESTLIVAGEEMANLYNIRTSSRLHLLATYRHSISAIVDTSRRSLVSGAPVSSRAEEDYYGRKIEWIDCAWPVESETGVSLVQRRPIKAKKIKETGSYIERLAELRRAFLDEDWGHIEAEVASEGFLFRDPRWLDIVDRDRGDLWGSAISFWKDCILSNKSAFPSGGTQFGSSIDHLLICDPRRSINEMRYDYVGSSILDAVGHSYSESTLSDLCYSSTSIVPTLSLASILASDIRGRGLSYVVTTPNWFSHTGWSRIFFPSVEVSSSRTAVLSFAFSSTPRRVGYLSDEMRIVMNQRLEV